MICVVLIVFCIVHVRFCITISLLVDFTGYLACLTLRLWLIYELLSLLSVGLLF